MERPPAADIALVEVRELQATSTARAAAPDLLVLDDVNLDAASRTRSSACSAARARASRPCCAPSPA